MNKTEVLCAFVAERIATHPYQLDGYLWGRMPCQDDMAEMIGMSPATIRRLIAKPPFVRRARKIEGKKTLLLRKGEPGPVTVNHIANTMSKLWRAVIAATKAEWQQERHAVLARLGLSSATWAAKKSEIVAALTTMAPGPHRDVKRLKRLDKLLSRSDWTTPREYGCMIGLAEVWPDGHQVSLFKMVVKRWPVFMVGVKFVEFTNAGDDADPDKQVFKLHLEFPSLSVMRLHPEVALEMATTDAQELGKAAPWIKALNPSLWLTAKPQKVA